jgi:hypothetical protein
MFALSRKEIMNLSQIVISSGIKHAPNVFVFTEQGVAMMSSVLKSNRAILVNIAIMRAFVRLKQGILSNRRLAEKLKILEKRVGTQDEKINEIFEAIRELTMPPPEPPKRRIGFHTD